MFSVIIPLYNKSQYIERAVISVLNQSLQKFEIIVVDDGSTDNSLAVINTLRENSSKVSVYTKPNGGVSSARNFGIEKSRFPYVAFLDADDYYHYKFLESVYLIINKIPSIEIITSAVSHKELQEKIEGFDYYVIAKYDFFKYLLRYHPLMSSSSTVIAKELIISHEINFDENLKFGEDTDFWNKCVKATNATNLIYISTKLAFYDNNDFNTSLGNNSLKPIQKTYFYKLLVTNESFCFPREKEFINFYLYRYYILLYESIEKQRLKADILNLLRKNRIRDFFYNLFLFLILKPWFQGLALFLFTYLRLLYSKSLNTAEKQTMHY